MHEDDKRNASEVTPEGAVEVDETALDEAAGGVSSWSQPTDHVSINVNKLGGDKADIKVFTPDASIGLLSEPQKKR